MAETDFVSDFHRVSQKQNLAFGLHALQAYFEPKL